MHTHAPPSRRSRSRCRTHGPTSDHVHGSRADRSSLPRTAGDTRAKQGFRTEQGLHEHARARDRHDRRADGAGAEGHRHGRDGRRGRDRDPRLLLRAAARAAGRRLPHVPRRGGGDAEAPGGLHARRAGRDGREDRAHLGEGRRGPELDARVHPRQPPARLPGLRQGRRVPAAGPDLPLRAREHPHDVPEAHVREADPDLAADRARPRALHPLLPLHALLASGRRGRTARRDQSRRAVGDRDLRGRAVRRRTSPAT